MALDVECNEFKTTMNTRDELKMCGSNFTIADEKTLFDDYTKLIHSGRSRT